MNVPSDETMCTHDQRVLVFLRPVARIFRRGVTWMCNLYKHTRLGGSGGMLPQEIFRN